ncbi:sensor histidine kinase [Blastococcus sp. BMG 814]|uniref:Sensor histidine kinase n=1 Tax=Blastococcus carthaginiensis TaxID=3050034 RepID=A0ABT9IGS0_9ACTN|nr:sensor histidine kinase [Blastococcus carthaginiensis]MDP5184768.1 sensor histidine kinase [Blastococcus carthaginiensis]
MEQGTGEGAATVAPDRSRARPVDTLPGVAHLAAPVGSDEELLAAALPYLDEGLRADDLVVLSFPPETAALVTGALGERAGTVEEDTRLCLLGTTVPDAVAAGRDLVRRARGTGSGRLRVAGQIRFGATPRDWREGLRYEAAVNLLLAARPVSGLCLLDRRELSAEVLAGVAATHPWVLTDGRVVPSGAFEDPAGYARRLPVPREPLEEETPALAVDDAPSLSELRRLLRAVIQARVPDPDQAADLHFAASEIASNAFRHGARPVSARVWGDGERLVCAITDQGHGTDVPFPGFHPAHGVDLAKGGMGLWLTRKLWDHVDLAPGPAGFTVRLSSRLR